MSRWQKVRCPVCGADFSSEPAFCSVCGESLVGWNTKPGDRYGFRGTGLFLPAGRRRGGSKGPQLSGKRFGVVISVFGALLFAILVRLIVEVFR